MSNGTRANGIKSCWSHDTVSENSPRGLYIISHFSITPLLDLPFVSGHWLLIAPVFIIRQTHLTIRVIRGRSSLLWAYAIQVAPSALVAIRDIPISVTHNLLPLLDLCGAGVGL